MVAGAGGYTHVRNIVLRRNAGDQSLRTVSPRHADHISPPFDGFGRQLQEVVAGLKQDRLDPASNALVGQPVALDFAPAGLGVHNQHRVTGSSNRTAP